MGNYNSRQPTSRLTSGLGTSGDKAAAEKYRNIEIEKNIKINRLIEREIDRDRESDRDRER